MKTFFFFLLFSNTIYFLWQYQRENLEKDFVWTEQTEKQILLVTEEQKQDGSIDENHRSF